MENSIKLISETVPVDTKIDDIITYCARVSNPSNQEKFDTAEKLLAYLMRHKHWSPFEMADLTFEFNTTRDISRQLLRHRSLCFQEFSQRYADVAEIGGVPVIRECRLQDTKNRQNSIELEHGEFDNDMLEIWWNEKLEQIQDKANSIYKKALKKGIAKECARCVLPEGLTMSRLYAKGSLRSWIHYCDVRRDKSTQKEHRDLANKIWKILCEKYPFLKSFDYKEPKVTRPLSFKVGDRVRKKSGDYNFYGEVISVIKKRNGHVRFAVENVSTDSAGMIHIFNAYQLKHENE